MIRRTLSYFPIKVSIGGPKTFLQCFGCVELFVLASGLSFVNVVIGTGSSGAINRFVSLRLGFRIQYGFSLIGLCYLKRGLPPRYFFG